MSTPVGKAAVLRGESTLLLSRRFVSSLLLSRRFVSSFAVEQALRFVLAAVHGAVQPAAGAPPATPAGGAEPCPGRPAPPVGGGARPGARTAPPLLLLPSSLCSTTRRKHRAATPRQNYQPPFFKKQNPPKANPPTGPDPSRARTGPRKRCIIEVLASEPPSLGRPPPGPHAGWGLPDRIFGRDRCRHRSACHPLAVHSRCPVQSAGRGYGTTGANRYLFQLVLSSRLHGGGHTISAA